MGTKRACTSAARTTKSASTPMRATEPPRAQLRAPWHATSMWHHRPFRVYDTHSETSCPSSRHFSHSVGSSGVCSLPGTCQASKAFSPARSGAGGARSGRLRQEPSPPPQPQHLEPSRRASSPAGGASAPPRTPAAPPRASTSCAHRTLPTSIPPPAPHPQIIRFAEQLKETITL